MSRGERRAVKGRVGGRVQGVFYRASLQREARNRSLTGWVRNCPDGTVEFLARGPADAVAALLDWARNGPPGARVTRLEAEEVREDNSGDGAAGQLPEESDDTDFTIRY